MSGCGFRVTGFVLALLLWAGASAARAEDVIYSEGASRVRYSDGVETDVQIGQQLVAGDSVFTGHDGLVEMERPGATIIISPGTVFSIQEQVLDGRRTDTLSVTLGALRAKLGTITGTEPRFRSPSAIAGVRGTELTVYAGADGSSLIVVDEGAVTVTAAGRTVEVMPQQGVEVRPGEAPGETFTVLRGSFDYSAWNGERLAQMLAAPLEALAGLESQLESHVLDLFAVLPVYESELATLMRLHSELVTLRDQESDQTGEFYDTRVAPQEVLTSNLRVNVRYHALSALSLRRFVLARPYLQLKVRHLASPDDSEYQAFLARYDQILRRYESEVVPQLVQADI